MLRRHRFMIHVDTRTEKVSAHTPLLLHLIPRRNRPSGSGYPPKPFGEWKIVAHEWTAEVKSTQAVLCPHERLRTSGPFAIHYSLFSPIGSLGTSFLHGRCGARSGLSHSQAVVIQPSVCLSVPCVRLRRALDSFPCRVRV